MITDQARLRFLLQRYTSDGCSREQMEELFGYIREARQDGQLNEVLLEEWKAVKPEETPEGYDWDEMFQKIIQSAPVKDTVPQHRVRFIKTAWFRYAAVFLLVAGMAGYFLLRHAKSGDSSIVAKTEDIPPGGNKAVLTLADGSVIMLDSAENGMIARQGGARILKLDAGKLSYEGVSDASLGFNTITTPRGGQYQVTLSDGTRVWLNAASSLRYPASFGRKPRKVEVKGEAYFEVAADKQHPFLVDLDGKGEIEVLGTHFNVNNYANEESARTTLLEGSVKITRGNETELLKPGQQAVVEEEIVINTRVDLAGVMAWKNGFFNWQDKRLEEVMKQLERWYDIDVRYEGKVPATRFTGDMDRGVNLSEVLKFLSESGIRLRQEGRKVVIE